MANKRQSWGFSRLMKVFHLSASWLSVTPSLVPFSPHHTMGASVSARSTCCTHTWASAPPSTLSLVVNPWMRKGAFLTACPLQPHQQVRAQAATVSTGLFVEVWATRWKEPCNLFLSQETWILAKSWQEASHSGIIQSNILLSPNIPAEGKMIPAVFESEGIAEHFVFQAWAPHVCTIFRTKVWLDH